MQKFLLTTLLLLTACGFEPIYGSHSNNADVAAELNQVAIENIGDRTGQQLRNGLIDRMYGKGRPRQPLYKLTVNLRSQEEDLGIQADATSTRTLLNVNADYALTDLKGKLLTRGSAHSVASFNKLSGQYATQAARENAFDRTINEAAEQITNRLSLYFATYTPKGATQ